MASEKKRNRVTLLDVAREAGVSRATASLVIRKSPLVSAETRRRVEETLERLGYVYNMGAARMRAARSQTVGVIIPNLNNPFFAEMLSGLQATLDVADMVVILANSRESTEKQRTIIRRMREHGVDGLIVCPATGTDESLLSDASEWGLPLVQALRYVSETAGDYAGSDYVGGMRQAVRRLYGLGHRRIAFLNGNLVHSAQAERLAGFKAGMKEHDLPDDLVTSIPLTQQSAIAAAARLYEGRNPPTAAICFNDVVGLGLSSGLYDLGLEVGRDFSVIGFDNVPEANRVRPKLTSVATHPETIGETAAQLLVDRLQSPDRGARRVINLTELVERQSCGAPRRPERTAQR
jgi:LacI family transcriptional regulator